jgi:hypothetical protein
MAVIYCKQCWEWFVEECPRHPAQTPDTEERICHELLTQAGVPTMPDLHDRIAWLVADCQRTKDGE